MATEAQRLIGISLTKIAQSRAHRGGVSLHKNLLVATVLQKARYIFMEEAYQMVHGGGYHPQAHVPQQPQDFEQQSYDDEEDNLVALTPEEAGIGSEPANEEPSETSLQDFLEPACVRCTETPKDKENVPPPTYQNQTELTYLDLDKSSNVLRERSGSQSTETGTTTTTCLKRRRAVTEWETEEAVLSILPKRSKSSAESEVADEEGDDSVFLDEAALFSDSVAREAASERQEEPQTCSSAMEIDRITSLVSIFSFGNLQAADSLGKLSRSVSTPDLCSAQAKESSVDALQQRPFLAMTV